MAGPSEIWWLLAAGADAYVSKPFSPKELLGVLAACLAEARRPPATRERG